MWIARRTGVRCVIPSLTFVVGYLTHVILNSTFSSKAPQSRPVISSPPQFLVILVLSSVSNHERRQTIRETWAKNVDIDAKILFVISGGAFTPEEQISITEEQEAHQDLLILFGIEESFHTLTLKVLLAFSWLTGDNLKLGFDGNTTLARPFSSFSYAMKCDDDSYVRVREILTELRTTYTSKMLYWGFFDGRAKVKKSGKYKELSWNICDTYLPYALGGGYVLAATPIHFITKNVMEWRRYQNEDTSIGAWLANLDGVERVHDPRFDTEYLSRGCHQSYLVTHKHSIQAMRKLHEQLMLTGQLCAKEYRTRLSYRYDWNVSPSKCCSRNNPSIP